TTIFSAASALLIRPLPGLAEPSRLVDVGRTQDGKGFDTVSYPNYKDLRERTKTLSGLYALNIEPGPISLGGAGDAERLYGTATPATYFEVLGSRPAAGRLLVDADDRAGAPAVAVISHALWQRKFKSDASAVGQAILINNRPFAIVGVAPDGFQGTTLL